MTRRPAFKPRLREQMRLNELSMLAQGMQPNDVADLRAAGEYLLPKQRKRLGPDVESVARDARAMRAADDTEAPVIAAVSELLATHPRVLLAGRANTGAIKYRAKSGKDVPIWFYRILTHSNNDMTLTDFWGFLRDGKPFCLEAKRPLWKEPREPREFRQAAFIQLIKNIGGRGGFVRSVIEAQEIIEGVA